MHALHMLLIFLSQKRALFLAVFVVVTHFCRDMSFVASTRFFGLVLMQTFMQTLRILCRYCADFCTKKCSVEALSFSRKSDKKKCVQGVALWP